MPNQNIIQICNILIYYNINVVDFLWSRASVFPVQAAAEYSFPKRIVSQEAAADNGDTAARSQEKRVTTPYQHVPSAVASGIGEALLVGQARLLCASIVCLAKELSTSLCCQEGQAGG
jgi:hypothetical protein